MLTVRKPAAEPAIRLQARLVPIQWNSALPVYASESFLKATGDEYGWIGGSCDSGPLRCILPFTVVRKLGVRMVRFRVETIPVGGELEIYEEKSFLDSVILYLRSIGAHLVVPSSNNAIFRTFPTGAVAAPYGTLINALDQSEEILWKQISEAYRKDIRRAVKNGVQIRSGPEYLRDAYIIIAETLTRSGMKFKRFAEFEALVASLGPNAKVFVAIHEGLTQAALLSPFSGHSAYKLYGGTIPNPTKGAMHLLHWEAIREFRRIGVKRFNFSGVRINPEKGSKQEGILNFKLRFGGQLVQGYLWKYPLCPVHFAAYNGAARLLHGGDVVDQERHKLVME